MNAAMAASLMKTIAALKRALARTPIANNVPSTRMTKMASKLTVPPAPGELRNAAGSSKPTAASAIISSSGKVHYVVASQGGVAGVGETLHRLSWEDATAGAEKLVADVAGLEALPEIDKDQWPAR